MIYNSGQNSTNQWPAEFKEFLEYFDNGGKGIYAESGFVVQLLVEKFGKQKVIDLLKKSSEFKTVDHLRIGFTDLYGFVATYAGFNALKCPVQIALCTGT